MSRTVHCSKLDKDAEGLDAPPYPGELGQKIYDTISKEAWQLWLKQQTMLINEYRLSVNCLIYTSDAADENLTM